MTTPAHPPTRLLLLRHAEVEAAYQRAFGGTIDMNLSPRGHQQAESLARHIRPRKVDRLYVSPMKRARQTVAPVAEALGLTPEVCPELHEVNFGDWTGLTWHEVHSRFGVHPFEWLAQLDQGLIPNGESGHGFRQRIEPGLKRIIAESRGKTVAVLCHGGVIRMMLSILLEIPLPTTASFEIEYASLSEAHIHAHRVELQGLNFVPWHTPV
jgi:broad specificity phosphatase PhoE